MFFKNHAQLQILRGWAPFFNKFHGIFCSKSRICHLASLPSLADSSQAGQSETYQLKNCISLPSQIMYYIYIYILYIYIYIPYKSTGTAPPSDLKIPLKEGGAVCDVHFQLLIEFGFTQSLPQLN